MSPDPSPNRPPKRQQRKACDLCRRRKVRCDIVDHQGRPCSVSTTQWAKPNRPSTHARRASHRRESTSSSVQQLRGAGDTGDAGKRRHDDSLLNSNLDDPSPVGAASATEPCDPDLNADATARKAQFARSGLARFFRHGIDAAAWLVFTDRGDFRVAYVGTAVSNLVHLVQLHRAFRSPPTASSPEDESVRRSLPLMASPQATRDGPVLDDHSLREQPGQSDAVVHYPYPPIRPAKGWKPGPDAWGGGATSLDLALDVSSFPAPDVRDALVAAYFQHIHPFHPVISMPEFLAAYRSPDKPPPLLLFQAVLMAGAHACSHHLVAQARHAVKTTLFRRASMLFHLRHETDRVNLMQAAVLFTRHIGDGDTVTGGPWYWSGIAMRIACGLGMHRRGPSLPPAERAEYRRCWWSAFVGEVLAALETGRPCAIRAEDIDQQGLSVDDMINSREATPTAETTRHATFLTHMVELAYVGLDILALNEPTPHRMVDVRALDARLCQWSLESGIYAVGHDDDDSWMHQLHLHYNLMLLHLHRNFPDEPSSQAICGTAARAIIAALERLVALDRLAECHFSAVSAVTAAGIQIAHEIRASVATRAFVVAISALDQLTRLLQTVALLAGYWPNAEAVHSVFSDIHQEYKAYVSQGLQGEPVLIPNTQPDWYRILAGPQPLTANPVANQDWLNITNWTGLL